MQGSVEDFMSAIRDRIYELANTSIESTQSIDETSIEDVLSWLAINEPEFYEDLHDMFGVSDLYSLDEEDLWEVFYDDDYILEELWRAFPDLRDDAVYAATNTGNIAISPDLEPITAEGNLDEGYYQSVVDDVGEEISKLDAKVGDFKLGVDSLSIIVNQDDNIHEYTVPFADLTGDKDKDIKYIVTAVSDDLAE